jgi:hypothetical protein
MTIQSAHTDEVHDLLNDAVLSVHGKDSFRLEEADAYVIENYKGKTTAFYLCSHDDVYELLERLGQTLYLQPSIIGLALITTGNARSTENDESFRVRVHCIVNSEGISTSLYFEDRDQDDLINGNDGHGLLGEALTEAWTRAHRSISATFADSSLN